MLKKLVKFAAAAALPTALALAAMAPPVHAEDKKLAGGNSSAELKQLVDSKLQGKRVAWMPTTLGFPLTDMWTHVMQQEADNSGIELIVRDPNWNPTTMTQIVSSLITEHPDVIVVHNMDVQLLAKQLKKAEEEGIYVIQVNMVSNYKTDAYVGADWIAVGRTVGEDVVETCGESTDTSHKVAIVQGDLTSAASIEQYEGFKQAVANDPTIEIVSDQAANWDATKANNVTATVLQQHPDLCATYGFWGTMQNGAAQAVKAAGKLDQVKVYASGEGNRFDCDNVRDGLFYKFLNYDAPAQARDIMNAAEFLLQSGLKPGEVKLADYSRLSWIDQETFDPAVCFDVPKS